MSANTQAAPEAAPPTLHDELARARQHAARVLDIAHGAPLFELGYPTRAELRAIAKALHQEHTSEGTCDLVESDDGFESVDMVLEAITYAWKRDELLVLHQSPGVDEAYMGAAASSCLLCPADRWLVPAFASVCVKQKRVPYIELLWVDPRLRRMGIGSLMVRDLCLEQPSIRRVRSCLLEALPFWDAVSEHVSRCPHHSADAASTPETRPPKDEAKSLHGGCPNMDENICGICGWCSDDCEHC